MNTRESLHLHSSTELLELRIFSIFVVNVIDWRCPFDLTRNDVKTHWSVDKDFMWKRDEGILDRIKKFLTV